MFIELTNKYDGGTTIAVNVSMIETIVQDHSEGCGVWLSGDVVKVKESLEQIRDMIPSSLWPVKGSIKKFDGAF